MPFTQKTPTLLRRRALRLLPLIFTLLTLLAWFHSANNLESVSYARGHTLLRFTTGFSMCGPQLFSRATPFDTGFRHHRTPLHDTTYWPPTDSLLFEGLGYSTDPLGLYIPFWLLLLLFTALTLYTFHRTRPRPKPTAFPITQDPMQTTPTPSLPMNLPHTALTRKQSSHAI